MRAAVADLDVARPRTLDDALGMLADDPTLVPMAGCTDIFVQLNFGQVPGKRYLDLWGLDALRGIKATRAGLRLGALATYSDLAASADVRKALPILVAASREIGGVQIQNRGTLGGNLINASPAADAVPVLMATDAVIVLASRRGGERSVPVNELYTGYRKTVRAADELVVRIDIAPVRGKQWFRKVGTRQAQAISKIVLAGVRHRSGAVALAAGSLGPTCTRMPRVEAALAAGDVTTAQASVELDVKPIDDIRSTAEYRLGVTRNLVARFWADVTGVGHAGRGSS